MEEITLAQSVYTELYQQLPFAVLILLVVWQSVAVIEKRDKNWLAVIKERDEQFVTEIRKYETNMEESRRELLEAFRESSSVMARCISVLEKVENKLHADEIRHAETRRRG